MSIVAKVARAAVKKAAKAKLPNADITVSAPAIIRSASGRSRRATSNATYDREAIARRYPETAPPEMRIDKDKGTSYPAKVNSAEALAVQQARLEAQGAIDAGEYTPYFDLSRRSYVDPSRFPLEGNTLDLVPATEKGLRSHEAFTRSPDAERRLVEAYETMRGDPMAEDWYAMEQLRDAFTQDLGPELGDLAFKYKFANSMAATTGGMSPRANMLTALYGNYMHQRGEPVLRESYNVPYPIGGHRLPGNLAQYERPLHELASRYDVDPARFQDVAWAGGKYLKDGSQPAPMMQTVNELIERTSRVTGLDPDEVLRDSIIRSVRPGYAKGGRVDSELACKCRA